MENVSTPPQSPLITSQKDEMKDLHRKKNLYPIVRHIFLIACVLLALLVLILLIYQNGKSIYDNGL